MNKFVTALLLSSTFCLGQSVLTTPVETTDAPVAGRAAIPTTGAKPTGATPFSESPLAPVVQVVQAPVTPNGTITTKTDFERFAEDATGQNLPIYGRKLFDRSPTTFAPIERVPVPVNYVLGPGDELLIRAWGKIDLDSKVTVDRNGQINLPKIGTLTVAGLRYEQISGFLHSAIGNLYKDFELNVTMGQLRSIEIYVLGNARQPGAYTVSSLSTLVNALFASGGPSATGTMRLIQLRRSDQVISEFDLYDLLQKGDKSHDLPLLPGDVIYIPTVGPQVALSGNVNNPGIYELKGATSVSSVIELAGGLTGLAGIQRATLERIDNHTSRSILEFSLDASALKKEVKDGDLLRIFPLSPKFDNAVTLQGNVAQQGRYLWKEGMRISDLIPSREFLISRDHWNRQNQLTATTGHEFNSSQAGTPRTEQAGAARTDMSDIVGKNNLGVNWEYAVIERLDKHDLSARLIPFRLANAIDNHDSTDNQTLEPGDVVSIFSRSDIEIPVDKRASFVSLGGEVNEPGVYRLLPGETLRDLVVQAGGLTSHSYLYASKLTRVSTRLAQEEQLRKYADQMQKQLLAQSVRASSTGSETTGSEQATLAKLVMQQNAIAGLTTLKPTGRIVLKMKPGASTVEDIPSFPLEDGDTFVIPPPQDTVEVAGAVYNESAFRYEPGKRAVAYLNDAGGATRDADKSRAFVIRADGSLVSKQSRSGNSHGSFEKMVLLPGDALLLPTRVKAPLDMKGISEIAQILSSAAVGASTIAILH